MPDAQTLKVGGRYNWRNQAERLIYMGMCEPRNGRWHQFALVEKPGEVWCEVHPSDLTSIEETAAGVRTAAVPLTEAQRDGLTVKRDVSIDGAASVSMDGEPMGDPHPCDGAGVREDGSPAMSQQRNGGGK